MRSPGEKQREKDVPWNRRRGAEIGRRKRSDGLGARKSWSQSRVRTVEGRTVGKRGPWGIRRQDRWKRGLFSGVGWAVEEVGNPLTLGIDCPRWPTYADRRRRGKTAAGR